MEENTLGRYLNESGSALRVEQIAQLNGLRRNALYVAWRRGEYGRVKNMVSHANEVWEKMTNQQK